MCQVLICCCSKNENKTLNAFHRIGLTAITIFSVCTTNRYIHIIWERQTCIMNSLYKFDICVSQSFRYYWNVKKYHRTFYIFHVVWYTKYMYIYTYIDIYCLQITDNKSVNSMVAEICNVRSKLSHIILRTPNMCNVLTQSPSKKSLPPFAFLVAIHHIRHFFIDKVSETLYIS